MGFSSAGAFEVVVEDLVVHDRLEVQLPPGGLGRTRIVAHESSQFLARGRSEFVASGAVAEQNVRSHDQRAGVWSLWRLLGRELGESLRLRLGMLGHASSVSLRRLWMQAPLAWSPGRKSVERVRRLRSGARSLADEHRNDRVSAQSNSRQRAEIASERLFLSPKPRILWGCERERLCSFARSAFICLERPKEGASARFKQVGP